jgi:hypothetical protein
VLLLLHVPKLVASVHVVVAPVQILPVPVIEAGAVATVTVITAAQAVPVAYDITDVPPETLVTKPVEEPTVATAVLLLLHVPPLIELLNVVVPPLHMRAVPVIAAGDALTESVWVACVPQPVE